MKSKWRTSALLEILVDQLLMMAGYALSLFLKFGTSIPAHNVTALRDTLPIAAVGGFILLAVYGAYNDRYRPLRETLVNLTVAVGILSFGVAALAFFLRGFAFPRSVLVMAPAIQLVFLFTWHGFNHLARRRKRGIFRVRIIGKNPPSAVFLRKMEHSLIGNKRLVLAGFSQLDVFGAEDVQGTLVHIDGVLLLSDVPDDMRKKVLQACAKAGVTLLCVPNPEDILFGSASLIQFSDIPVLVVEQSTRRQELQWMKRIFDICFSFAAMLLASPFFLLTILLVRISGPGPVFFVQERLTRDCRIFRLIKFRTMVQHAELKSGPVLSIRNDPRITPVGRFLRKSRLDELPQLWNILRGDMSLVGPRPERPVFVEKHTRDMPGYQLRHAVRAGLTGLAQVYGNYSTTAGDKLVFDLVYIRDWSLLLDMQIMLRTVTAVFRREAAEGIEEEVRT